MNTPINENLQNAAQNYSGKASHPLNNAFIAGANWQREQDQETIEVAEDHAVFAGRIQMKEELEQDAISCSVDEDSPFLFLDYNPEQEHNYLQSKGFKPGDKVKVIVIKEN